MSKKILSGIQPTGIIHLGNYFGAIHNWLDLQKKYQGIFFIADLHALTIFQKPQDLRKNIRNLVRIYLATGLDPKKNIIFQQSAVHEHVELSWILSCLLPIAELERMTQYKDKAQQHKKNVNTGLFSYPALMSADILLYDTDLVPVGDDQNQHVELARTLAKKFNNTYGKTFVVPDALVKKISGRLKGLDDPTKKMSKSAGSENNYIALTDKPDVIRKKIKKAVTDTGAEIKFEPKKKPAISNLMLIYHMVTGLEQDAIEKKFAHKGYGDFKAALAEKVVKFVEPIQKKYNSLSDKQIDAVLTDGAARASKLAAAKMSMVRKKVGIL